MNTERRKQRTGKASRPKTAFSRNRRNGSALIGIIVAIVLVGLLAAVLVSMNTSATYGELKVNHMNRAYYVAESGLWYTFARLSENFDDAPGYYYPGGGYNDPSGETITLPGGDYFNVRTEPLYDGEGAVDPSRVRLFSTGTVGAGTIWEANRQIVFDLDKPHEGLSEENLFEVGDDLTNFDIAPGEKQQEAVIQTTGTTTDGQPAVSINADSTPNQYVSLSVKWCNLPGLNIKKAWNKKNFVLSY